MLLVPSVIVLLLWMIVPLVMTLWFSFQYYNLVEPERPRGFAGIDNYRYLVTDPDFWVSLRNTLILLASVLVITVGLGILLAVLFNQPFPGRNIARVLAISPFFVMPTVSALIWKNLMMHPIYGVFGAIARALRACSRSIGSREFPLASVIAIVSWEWLPFALLILLTAVQSLDHEQREAARMDGAGVLAQFFFITLPHLVARHQRGDHDRDDLPADGVRRDLRHHLGRPGQRDHQSRLPDLRPGACCNTMSAAPRPAAWSPSCWPTSSPSSWCAASPAGWRSRRCEQPRCNVCSTTIARLGRRAAAVLPDRLDGADQLQVRDATPSTPPDCSFTPDARVLPSRCSRAPTILRFALNSIVISVGGTVLALAVRDPGGLLNGVPSHRAHPRHAAMDAVDQDAAAGRRAGADLPAVPHRRSARHAVAVWS